MEQGAAPTPVAVVDGESSSSDDKDAQPTTRMNATEAPGRAGNMAAAKGNSSQGPSGAAAEADEEDSSSEDDLDMTGYKKEPPQEMKSKAAAAANSLPSAPTLQPAVSTVQQQVVGPENSATAAASKPGNKELAQPPKNAASSKPVAVAAKQGQQKPSPPVVLQVSSKKAAATPPVSKQAQPSAASPKQPPAPSGVAVTQGTKLRSSSTTGAKAPPAGKMAAPGKQAQPAATKPKQPQPGAAKQAQPVAAKQTQASIVSAKQAQRPAQTGVGKTAGTSTRPPVPTGEPQPPQAKQAQQPLLPAKQQAQPRAVVSSEAAQASSAAPRQLAQVVEGAPAAVVVPENSQSQPVQQVPPEEPSQQQQGARQGQLVQQLDHDQDKKEQQAAVAIASPPEDPSVPVVNAVIRQEPQTQTAKLAALSELEPGGIAVPEQTRISENNVQEEQQATALPAGAGQQELALSASQLQADQDSSSPARALDEGAAGPSPASDLKSEERKRQEAKGGVLLVEPTSQTNKQVVSLSQAGGIAVKVDEIEEVDEDDAVSSDDVEAPPLVGGGSTPPPPQCPPAPYSAPSSPGEVAAQREEDLRQKQYEACSVQPPKGLQDWKPEKFFVDETRFLGIAVVAKRKRDREVEAALSKPAPGTPGLLQERPLLTKMLDQAAQPLLSGFREQCYEAQGKQAHFLSDAVEQVQREANEQAKALCERFPKLGNYSTGGASGAREDARSTSLLTKKRMQVWGEVKTAKIMHALLSGRDDVVNSLLNNNAGPTTPKARSTPARPRTDFIKNAEDRSRARGPGISTTPSPRPPAAARKSSSTTTAARERFQPPAVYDPQTVRWPQARSRNSTSPTLFPRSPTSLGRSESPVLDAPTAGFSFSRGASPVPAAASSKSAAASRRASKSFSPAASGRRMSRSSQSPKSVNFVGVATTKSTSGLTSSAVRQSRRSRKSR
ncbi:unnamed protein product [Amoebophrya sp. A120]|nr:unnamed protein product [Amoebophrya sp. A120]|eukprot:GSA120T00003608001.1